MPGTREIKRRIRSVGSTKKITRAMQMISAVKMRKAQAAVLASRTYSRLAWQIITNLSDKVDPKYNRLLETPAANDQNKIGIILISTNRGMVGGFNTNLLNAVNKYLASQKDDGELVAELVAVGRKGRDAVIRMGKTVVAEFDKYDRTLHVDEIAPLSKLVINDYLAGKYSKIVIAYTEFVSTIVQHPKITQILPLAATEHPEHLKETDSHGLHYEYLFEPDPVKVLDYLLPRIIQSQIYQAILENDAAEHSARMIMMKNATDAADDLISDLTLTYNQLRQANITKELAEITAGRIALE